MKLIDAYLSEDFKSLINSMSKINMTDLDYETKNVVQKMINKRHFKMEMEYYKKKNTLKKSSTSSTKGRNLNRASSSDFILSPFVFSKSELNYCMVEHWPTLQKSSGTKMQSSK